ncbi:toxin CptA [Gammaproteobacteria bacterium]
MGRIDPPWLPMSSNRSSEPLRIDLRSSPHLALFLLIAHGGALALVPLLTLPLWAALGVAVGVAVSLSTTLHTYALLRGRYAVVCLVWTGEGRWVMAYADGMVRDAELMPGSFVHPNLVVLTFSVAGAPFPLNRRSVILASDSVDPATFRRLRVRLRVGSP